MELCKSRKGQRTLWSFIKSNVKEENCSDALEEKEDDSNKITTVGGYAEAIIVGKACWRCRSNSWSKIG